MSEKNLTKKGNPITIRPPAHIMAMLDEAQKTTGMDRSDIILKCIEAELAIVERRETERRLREAQEGMNRLKSRLSANPAIQPSGRSLRGKN